MGADAKRRFNSPPVTSSSCPSRWTTSSSSRSSLRFFASRPQYQHRVLFWGILGALLMRGMMIVAGAALVQLSLDVLSLWRFSAPHRRQMLSAGRRACIRKKIFCPRRAKVFPRRPRIGRPEIPRPVDGRLLLTPLAFVLLVVETADLIFALDSIPALFAVTTKPFIVFTSNVFAILGLRSLYFLLVGAIGYFRYLKIGLSIRPRLYRRENALDPHGEEPKWFQVDIPTGVSLMIVAAIVLICYGAVRDGRGTGETHRRGQCPRR